MRLYGDIRKIDAEQRLVSGYASTECVDAHGEVVLKSAIEAALEDYLEYGNLREMHQLSAVGVTEEATIDDRGLYICAKVTDDVAWGKVTSGTYKGFSIGGRTLARDKDNKKIITKIALNEISLVDRPSNPEARFDVWKAAGLHEGAESTADLAKVTGERDALAKGVAHRDRVLGELADRVEPLVKTVASLVEQNKTLRAANSDLSKRLAQKPRVVVDNVISRTDQLLGGIETALADVEAKTADLAARFKQLEA
jgi:phage head maturation protease/regulator of replication initiation timing